MMLIYIVKDTDGMTPAMWACHLDRYDHFKVRLFYFVIFEILFKKISFISVGIISSFAW